MHIKTRNVNTAFCDLVTLFHNKGRAEFTTGGVPYWVETQVISRSSRNGNVMMIDEPVTITYSHPRERVLFNSARDANPFFHLYEALWMLAGRNDVDSVGHYAKQMYEYSDDGYSLNGAYGHRWRKAISVQEGMSSAGDHMPAVKATWLGQPIDQLRIIADHLRYDPNSRRAVLQMWNVMDDLKKIGEGNCTCTKNWGDHYPGCRVNQVSKDIACNLSVMFALREGKCPKCNGTGTIHHIQGPSGLSTFEPCVKTARYLDITVTNRSNDLIWGLLGANYVHFTILQEYMAARIGAEVGVYHHFTNNLHVYDWNWKPDEWLECEQGEAQRRYHPDLTLFPLVKSWQKFEEEVHPFTVLNDGNKDPAELEQVRYEEPFLQEVAQPAMTAHRLYKLGDIAGALARCGTIAAQDWRIACQQWIKKREKK